MSSVRPIPALVADIGGTNARFGWIAHDGAAIDRIRTLPCAEHATLADAVRAYLCRHRPGAAGSMAMGIANPVTGDEIRMTNHHWGFDLGPAGRAYWQRLVVINDFTGAGAGAALAQHELRQSRWRPRLPAGPDRADRPGHQLGVSVCWGRRPVGRAGRRRGRGRWRPATPARRAIIAVLRERYGYPRLAERAICGAGPVALYEAVCQARWRGCDRVDAGRRQPPRASANAPAASRRPRASAALLAASRAIWR